MRVPGISYVQGRNNYRDWDERKYGIAIHNTSNDASDEGEASYASRRTDGVSAHLYVDHDSVTQSLDLDDRAGHAGSAQGNDHSIAVEITGANGKSRSWWLKNVAWDKLGQVLAWIITHDPDYRGFEVRRPSVAEMRRNPRVKALYGHDDMRRAWGGTTHTDPGPNFPWDRLLRAVNEHLEEDDVSAEDVWRHRWEKVHIPGQETSAEGAVRWIHKHVSDSVEREEQILANQAAILAAVAGQDVSEAVRAELDRAAQRERAERAAERQELAEALAPALVNALAEQLTDVTGDQLEAASEAALRTVFGELAASADGS